MSAGRAFTIETPSINLKVTIEEVNKLYIHEEIIPRILEWLVEKIKRDGVFKDPIIVDEKTLVVLDGMHRVAAAKELGFKYIPVCLVDYDSPSIKLYAWSRVVKLKESTRTAFRELEDASRVVVDSLSGLGYRLVRVPGVEAGFAMLDRREIAVLVVTPTSIIGARHVSRDIKYLYDTVKRVETALENKGFEVGYYPERDSIELVSRGEAVAAVIPPVIRKEEVRTVALRGEVFVHKATRHVIPARPMNIRVPLDWLIGSLSIEEVRDLLYEHLSRMSYKRLPPGTLLDRRYEEEVYYFE